MLVVAAGEHAIVSVQNPVRLSQHSEPQLDFAVLKPRDYKAMLPRPEDTLLAVEVASTSLGYARSGIPEV